MLTQGPGDHELSRRLDHTVRLADAAHDGKAITPAKRFRRDGNTPAFAHPLRVAELLYSWGVADEDILKAALCHDLLEDTHMTAGELADHIGMRAANFVVLLTKPRSMQKRDYLESFAGKDRIVALIKMVDRLDNLNDDPKDPRAYAIDGLRLLAACLSSTEGRLKDDEYAAFTTAAVALERSCRRILFGGWA